MNEFDKFVFVDGESFSSVYERFSTLINIMDRNGVILKEISINTSPSYSHSPQPYYLTHPSSMIDYEGDYQREIQGDAQEDKMATKMMLLARAITQLCFTPTNNRLRMVTRIHEGQTRIKKLMQEIVWFNILKNMIKMFSGFQELSRLREMQMFSATTAMGKANIHEIVQKLEFVMQMMMMACIQPTDDKSDAVSTYDVKVINEVNNSQIDLINGLLSKGVHKHKNHEKLKTVIHTSANDQTVSDIIFDDPYMEDSGGQDEHDSNAHDQSYPDIESLIYNVQVEVVHQRKMNNELDLVSKFITNSLCYPTNNHDDLGKMKPKAEIDSSEDSNSIPLKKDLDNLFGPLYEENYKMRTLKVSDNSATNDLHNEDTPSSYLIILEENEAPQLVSSSKEPIANEPTTPVSDDNADESVQEYIAELDGHTFINPFHTLTKNHPLEHVIGDPSKPIMTRRRLHTDDGMCMYALTVHQSSRKIFNSQLQYALEILKKHGMDGCDSISTPMATARINADLQDYGYCYTKIPMYSDSKSAIAISCNMVQHYRTQHINIRDHFFKEHVEQVDHALSYDLTATADVPTMYLQQLWKTVKQVPNQNEINRFMVDRQEITYTVDILIIANIMVKFESIPKILEEDYHSIKDDTPLMCVYTTRNVTVQGMLIIDDLLIDEIRDTQVYKDYVKKFEGVDVPIIQPKPIESTQGTHRTPNPADKSSTTIPPLSDDKERDEIPEATLLSLALHETAKAFEGKNVTTVEKKILEEDVEMIVEGKDKEFDATDFDDSLFLNDEKILEKMEEMDETLCNKVPELTVSITNDLLKETLSKMVTDAISALISQEFADHVPQIIKELFRIHMQNIVLNVHPITKLWDVLRAKFEKSSASVGSYKDDAFLKCDHDDHHRDDAPLEGEKHSKRQNTSKVSKSARGFNKLKTPTHQHRDNYRNNKIGMQGLMFLEIQMNLQGIYKIRFIFLKYGNNEEKRYVLSLHKIHHVPFPEEDLEKKLNRWEKRFMDLVEIVKFCDVTLEKVLKEVKLKIFKTEFMTKAPLLAPILSLPEGSKNFMVYYDASHKGLGMMLMKIEKVIAYASGQLKVYEKNYTIHDLERSCSVRCKDLEALLVWHEFIVLLVVEITLNKQTFYCQDKDIVVPGVGFNFCGIISSCLEPHLIVYEIEHLKSLLHLRTTTSDVGERDQANISNNSHVKERENFHAVISTLVVNSRAFEEDVASLAKLTKAYMGESTRPAKVSPSTLRHGSQAPRQDLVLLNTVTILPSTLVTSLAPKTTGEVDSEQVLLDFIQHRHSYHLSLLGNLKGQMGIRCELDSSVQRLLISSEPEQKASKIKMENEETSKRNSGYASVPTESTQKGIWWRGSCRSRNETEDEEAYVEETIQDAILITAVKTSCIWSYSQAYRLELPQQLSKVHSTFHVSNLKKCLSDETLVIPLEEIQIDDKLYFIKEPIEITDREFKRLKQSRHSIVKEISPKDTRTFVSPSTSVGSSSSIRSTISSPDYLFNESIFAELNNSLWIIPRPLGEEPVLEELNESDTCWNDHLWK
uniref:Uncharacterized protein n=1 Tax=Tanacetum cinerariifolium TaxID=118510 RepID=A0A6L2KS52_TANCI|nr:hypothetical protein [Tanacetum cinerariifolium]